MKTQTRLKPLFLSLILSSAACTHTASRDDESLSADEATVEDSDSQSQTLPKTETADDESLDKDREVAKEATPLVESVSIVFEGKGSKLPSSSDALLKDIAYQMKLDRKLKLRLEAYSRKDGQAVQKKKLATEALDNVKKKLLKLGVDGKRIRVSGFDKNRIDDDRRVDVVFE
jgi:outer membrane protein OmpA-like peptidoglycan-associated protein